MFDTVRTRLIFIISNVVKMVSESHRDLFFEEMYENNIKIIFKFYEGQLGFEKYESKSECFVLVTTLLPLTDNRQSRIISDFQRSVISTWSQKLDFPLKVAL